jgi:diguanylate cyclase (GGDEF)-like protein
VPPDGQALIERVSTHSRLPTLPTVASRILELTRDESAPLDQIAECVELDQALAAKILRTINSSFYGLSSPCRNIGRAISYLGMNSVRSLVLSFSLIDCFKDQEDIGGLDLIAHWRRAMYGAVAARLAATRLRECDPDEAFLAALLRDIGSLAMAISLGSEYEPVVEASEGVHHKLAEAERETLGVDHATLGAALAGRWRLPEELVEAIACHHDSGEDADEALARSVLIGSAAADALSEHGEERAPGLFRLSDLGERWLRMDAAGVEQFLEELKPNTLSLLRLFELDTGDPPDIRSILEEAEEQKLTIQMQQEREARELRERAERLSRERFIDGLTGVKNRAAFDRDLNDCFDAAKRGDGEMAVAFLDADHFKSVNDTHGHQAGDLVLMELARRLRETLGESGEPYRYGGEEFAVLMPETSASEAADLSERLREAVAQSPFDLDETADIDDLAITVSIGVAVYDAKTRALFTAPSLVVKAADDAVYRAKKAGRNRTILHEPQADSADENANDAPADHAEEPPLRVLLVDDDPMHQKLFSTALENTGRADVKMAASVPEAVKLLHFGDGDGPLRPDLVITDLRMPDHSGEKLVRFIRTTGSLVTTPVIVLSGSEQDEDVRRCLAAGANAFLPKDALSSNPFDGAARLLEFWSLVARAA